MSLTGGRAYRRGWRVVPGSAVRLYVVRVGRAKRPGQSNKTRGMSWISRECHLQRKLCC